MLYERFGDFPSLERVIDLLECALAASAEDHADYLKTTEDLSDALESRYHAPDGGDPSDLDRAISLKEKILEQQPDNMDTLRKLVESLDVRFDLDANPSDANQVIELEEQMLDLCDDQEDLSDEVQLLQSLVQHVSRRFEESRDAEDLDRMIELEEMVLETLVEDDHDFPEAMRALAGSLCTRFKMEHDADHDQDRSPNPYSDSFLSRHPNDESDIDRAIDLCERSLTLCPPEHGDHAEALHRLACCLEIRFMEDETNLDIDRAIELREEVLALGPRGRSPSDAMRELAGSHRWRFCASGDPSDANRAIELGTQALKLFPSSHPDRTEVLKELAMSHSARAEREGKRADLDAGVKLTEERLTLHSEDDSESRDALCDLSWFLQRRFTLGGDSSESDIGRAIELLEQYMNHFQEDELDYWYTHSYLAETLYSRYRRDTRCSDLDRAIELDEALLDKYPDHPDPVVKRTLAGCLYDRYLLGNDPSDLDDATDFGLSGLQEDPTRDDILEQLVRSLCCRAHLLETEIGNSRFVFPRLSLASVIVDMHPMSPANAPTMIKSMPSSFSKAGRRMSQPLY